MTKGNLSGGTRARKCGKPLLGSFFSKFSFLFLLLLGQNGFSLKSESEGCNFAFFSGEGVDLSWNHSYLGVTSRLFEALCPPPPR